MLCPTWISRWSRTCPARGAEAPSRRGCRRSGSPGRSGAAPGLPWAPSPARRLPVRPLQHRFEPWRHATRRAAGGSARRPSLTSTDSNDRHRGCTAAPPTPTTAVLVRGAGPVLKRCSARGGRSSRFWRSAVCLPERTGRPQYVGVASRSCTRYCGAPPFAIRQSCGEPVHSMNKLWSVAAAVWSACGKVGCGRSAVAARARRGGRCGVCPGAAGQRRGSGATGGSPVWRRRGAPSTPRRSRAAGGPAVVPAPGAAVAR
jgi:hypothetical protein